MFAVLSFFFFNDTATTEIYTLSLHDALPIWLRLRQTGRRAGIRRAPDAGAEPLRRRDARGAPEDRKSTRLNSSHVEISYAVFCLKKKKNAAQASCALKPISHFALLVRSMLVS